MPASDQGVFVNRYQIIPRALVFATRGDSVLLIKGAADKKIWPNLYNGVGGHIEMGEDPLSTAKREFHEETGLVLLNPWLCAVVTIDTQQPVGIGMYVFRGNAGDGQFKASHEGTLEWVPRGRLDTLQLVEDLPVLLPRVLDMQAGDQVLSAQYSYDAAGKLLIRFAQTD
jgi:8-oxo-dGTP diphosphatase